MTVVWVQGGSFTATQNKEWKHVRQPGEPWESAAVGAPSLTCSLWNLSASVQRRLRAPPHTERTACRWGCSSDSCRRFWSRRPQTRWACGNVVFANGFPLWRSLQRTEEYVHGIFCFTAYYEINNMEFIWIISLAREYSKIMASTMDRLMGQLSLVLTHWLLDNAIIIRCVMGIHWFKERPCHFMRLLKDYRNRC